ncbi:hypothetical protein ACEN9X_11335 [Mucilaginibacter sp. Mucisp86]|uniref:hypothetical protein n=1 Tax=Mucilaginibacter sp. Mucisp86 TaxID=3243060 RepID=UPI0039B4D204
MSALSKCIGNRHLVTLAGNYERLLAVAAARTNKKFLHKFFQINRITLIFKLHKFEVRVIQLIVASRQNNSCENFLPRFANIDQADMQR